MLVKYQKNRKSSEEILAELKVRNSCRQYFFLIKLNFDF
jgi:hypothetical protein